MSNSTQQLKAEQRRKQFADLLREMFQLNQPELDFGLYRIMHARKDDINRFIERDLPSITKEAFKSFASQDKTQVQQELDKAIQGAQALDVDPDALPKVQELKAKLADNFDLAREEGEVYDALITFFNRYYSEGDFLSRRVYKNDTYAIPYQGEEVVLHWANKDQYYIKSSETLRDYSFRLVPGAQEGEDPLRVHFKLVDVEAGAKDNNKEAADNKRVFVLDAEHPFELVEGEPNASGERFSELVLRFFYRVAVEADWTPVVKQTATPKAQKKAPKQDHLLSIAIDRLLGTDSALVAPWKQALAHPYRKADGELADYSALQGQLNNYTKRNTFDYFIHKDLGGFLTRELDFYVKNELLDWADIATLKNDPARLAPLLSKVEVIRSLGEKIISFLAQLENFQKKLWLKKKFVTEAHYCITLDRLENYPELLTQVFETKNQLDDWKTLYKLDLIQLDSDLRENSPQALLAFPQYRYLALDTCHFDNDFKNKLLASFYDIDEQLDGVLVHSENFQALNLLQERYREKIKCVYIDPPYNTGGGDFLYKDAFFHSSWLSMSWDRLTLGSKFMSQEGVQFTSLDDSEITNFRSMMSLLSPESELGVLVWDRNRKNDARFFSVGHEYMIVNAKNKTFLDSAKVRFREPKEGLSDAKKLYKKLKKEHGDDYSSIRADWLAWLDDMPLSDPRRRMRRYTKVNDLGPYRDDGNPSWPGGGGPRYEILHPKTNMPVRVPSRGWVWPTAERFWEEHEKGKIIFGKDHTTTPGVASYLFDGDGQVMPSVFYSYAQTASQEFDSLWGGKVFDNPKNWKDISRVINYIADQDSVILDFFAGSGTTAQSVISLNRDDDGNRKYLLIEMGEHFNTVVLPRIKKVSYSDTWRDGEPKVNLEGSTSGVSQAFKYVRLESYEDALGNLSLNRPIGQQQLIQEADSDETSQARQAYLMNYMLEIETRDSQSLLNTQQFLDPNRYELTVRSAGGDETRVVCVDLVETFNYLLGLKIEHIAAPLHFEAELSQGEFGRWQASVKRRADGRWWFRTVFGTNRNGQKVLVVWRNLPSVIAGEADGLKWDNAVLDAVLIEKLAIRLTESPDDEIDILYVNGDHNIAIPRNRKGEPMEHARIQLIEEAFHRLMFADTETVQ